MPILEQLEFINIQLAKRGKGVAFYSSERSDSIGGAGVDETIRETRSAEASDSQELFYRSNSADSSLFLKSDLSTPRNENQWREIDASAVSNEKWADHVFRTKYPNHSPYGRSVSKSSAPTLRQKKQGLKKKMAKLPPIQKFQSTSKKDAVPPIQIHTPHSFTNSLNQSPMNSIKSPEFCSPSRIDASDFMQSKELQQKYPLFLKNATPLHFNHIRSLAWIQRLVDLAYLEVKSAIKKFALEQVINNWLNETLKSLLCSH